MNSAKPGRGRPKSGVVTVPIMLRIPERLAKQLDRHCRKVRAPNRQSAIRDLIANTR